MRYEEFILGHLFTFKAIKQSKSQSLIPDDKNGIPYIVQSTRNNMFSRKVNKQWLIDNNEPPIEGNKIVLGVTLPAVSYQPYKFGASQVITASADFLNEQIGLYIVTQLEKLINQFSYSRKPGLQIYKAMKLQLPIKTDKKDNPIIDTSKYYHEEGFIPDFEYMEKYISELEKERISELEKYLIATDLNDYELTEEDKYILALSQNLITTEELNCKDSKKNSLQVREFKISDLFTIKNSHNILKSEVDFTKKIYPYVTAQEGNNSIMDYVDYKEELLDKGNCIFIGGKTLIISYQKEDFFSNDSHNLLLYLNNEYKTNENIALYLISSLYKSLKPKYNWNNSISYKKIINDIFELPILTNNKNEPVIDEEYKYHPDGYIPDFEYMEKYIKAIEKLVITDVVLFKDKILQETPNIILEENKNN